MKPNSHDSASPRTRPAAGTVAAGLGLLVVAMALLALAPEHWTRGDRARGPWAERRSASAEIPTPRTGDPRRMQGASAGIQAPGASPIPAGAARAGTGGSALLEARPDAEERLQRLQNTLSKAATRALASEISAPERSAMPTAETPPNPAPGGNDEPRSRAPAGANDDQPRAGDGERDDSRRTGPEEPKRRAASPAADHGAPVREALARRQARARGKSAAAAQRFLARAEQLEGLEFQPASGYWTNTYLPGDPVARLLEARLRQWDRRALGAQPGDGRLESLALPNRQPFDLPRHAALAAYLHADKRAVQGPSRLRIQVGLQASHKRGGLRPDMSVGVVLDLRRPLNASAGTRMRALMLALATARQAGDRFSITVAGHPGGQLVAPDAFRHGRVQVAMQALLSDSGRSPAPAMDLLAAMDSATRSVRRSDDASAPLGASLILLVSTAPVGGQGAALERMAHENAAAGIGLSVVALGEAAGAAVFDRLVLLGQGRRRVLASAEDAPALVDRELHAASRAVARALRLRVRLAPGVQLIDVLGSHRLSLPAADRVRAAERSIDRRLARNLGIHADRGEDQEGIQILIPGFYAGDSHTVLLDVRVSGPGPVADLSVRYKDLVYRRNGIASARLVLGDAAGTRGPLEHNVLKNHLARHLVQAVSSAADQLGRGDGAAAAATLEAARTLTAGMREVITGWRRDLELGCDLALLDRYLAVLATPLADRDLRHLAESLHLAAFRRLTPPRR